MRFMRNIAGLLMFMIALGITSSHAQVGVNATLQSAAVANGNGTEFLVAGNSGSILTVNCNSCGGGTTVNFEASEDGTNYTSISAIQVGTATNVTSTTTSGITVWQVSVAGMVKFRARISAYSAGTITVTGHAFPVANGSLTAMAGTGAAAQQVQGTAANAATATGNPVRIGGTNGSDSNINTVTVSAVGQLSVTGSHVPTDGSSNLGGRFVYDNAPSGASAPVEIYGWGFNGVTWDRSRTASSTNVGNTAQLGVNLVDSPGQWAVFHQPAAATAATISQAAGATVRHVAKSVTVCISAVAAQPDIIFNLRDGASGAGTIKWTVRMAATAGTSQCQTATFTIPGTLNTAMTLESASAPAATNFATVSVSGYDIQ